MDCLCNNLKSDYISLEKKRKTQQWIILSDFNSHIWLLFSIINVFKILQSFQLKIITIIILLFVDLHNILQIIRRCIFMIYYVGETWVWYWKKKIICNNYLNKLIFLKHSFGGNGFHIPLLISCFVRNFSV